MTAYYNDNEPYIAQWLRNLISAGHIAPGDVDERSCRRISEAYRQPDMFIATPPVPKQGAML